MSSDVQKMLSKVVKMVKNSGESRKLIGEVQVLVKGGQFTKFTKDGCIEQSRVTTVG